MTKKIKIFGSTTNPGSFRGGGLWGERDGIRIGSTRNENGLAAIQIKVIKISQKNMVTFQITRRKPNPHRPTGIRPPFIFPMKEYRKKLYLDENGVAYILLDYSKLYF